LLHGQLTNIAQTEAWLVIGPHSIAPIANCMMSPLFTYTFQESYIKPGSEASATLKSTASLVMKHPKMYWAGGLEEKSFIGHAHDSFHALSLDNVRK
jgi:hypothetical protein